MTTATEILERIHAEHGIECLGLGEVTCQACRERSWMSLHAYHNHVAMAQVAALVAAGLLDGAA